MLLRGNANSKKTDILIENYAQLLNKGIESDSVLVIVQNSFKKASFIQKAKKLLKIDALSKFNIYTYFGLCYNFILEYWPLIENNIKDTKNVLTEPNLSGLEASEYILKDCIEKTEFKGYNSKINLLHQILRRNSLITLNALCDEEVNKRIKVLKESFSLDVKKAINLYKRKTLDLRAFDYLRQINLFTYIYKNIKNPYKYVFIDDADEMTPSLFEYLKYLKDNKAEFFVGYDKNGTTRKGFLGAIEIDFEKFLNEKSLCLDTSDDKVLIADEIFTSVKKNEPFMLQNGVFQSFIKKDEMIENVVSEINSLLKKGVCAKDIAIITPDINDYLKFSLKGIKAPLTYLSGSEKLNQNKTVNALLNILNLANKKTKNEKISPYIIKGLLTGILNLDTDTALKISLDFESDPEEFDIFKTLNKFRDNEIIESFIRTVYEISNMSLSEKLYTLAQKYVKKEKSNKDDIGKINQLLKQIRDFENIFKNSEKNVTDILLNQLQNTIISENPSGAIDLADNSVVISTAQKIIDLSYETKYTFLIDTTSSSWTKQDIGPLYNAWVFQKNWSKKTYDLTDNIELTQDKTARLLRKLYILNNGTIYFYSSIYDFLGIENFKGINHYFKSPIENNTAAENKKTLSLIPRADQKPVLEYKEGKMAVSAVAGAGKTTIMLALIMKLLNEGVNAQNIFVLTFMESAARNFKERIKKNFPNLLELPHISTIHGLSLRILRENSNHTALGLDENFDIADETVRNKILCEILYNAGLPMDKTELYDRAISSYKNQTNVTTDYLKPLFKSVLNEYQKTLFNLNMIDYDDLLTYALKLLKTNRSIREYYQELAHYVIEDEAQDSSAIQQELISILGAKKGNVIRTGDVNQAITTTFSNADTKGFKSFISKYNSVTMNYSNRNATGIIKLANDTVKYGLKKSAESFLNIETKAVEGKNIVDPNAVITQIFENEHDEKKFTLARLNEIFAHNPDASAAILLRSNKSADIWANYIKDNSKLKPVTKSDNLNNNPVFKVLLAILNFINDPYSRKNTISTIETLIQAGFYKSDHEVFKYIENLNTPFILSSGEYFALWWDLRYFVSKTYLSPFELAYTIAEFYFANDLKEKSNIPPAAAIVSKMFNNWNNFEDTLLKLNDIAKRPYRGNLKFFDDENTHNEMCVDIVTMHKSKGSEYDYVFIPELTENNIGLDVSCIKLKESSRFVESVKLKSKTDEQLKKDITDENFRLIYVALTRAKKKLFLTASKEYKFYKKIKNETPCEIFKITEQKGGIL